LKVLPVAVIIITQRAISIMNKLLNDFNTKFKGSTKPKETKVYTGTNMIGIAQIPKSNAQPVFSQQEALDTVKVK
jgi:hypothetical protein